MKRIRVKRIWSNDTGTFGVMCDTGGPFAVTVELPWRNNAVRVSCIPAGLYSIDRVKSPKFGNTFGISNVEGRTHILLHRANTIDDLLGCIGVAEAFNVVNGVRGVTESAKGFAEFLKLLEGESEAELLITEHYDNDP